MLFLTYHEVMCIAEERLRDCLREAERRRLLRQAGMDERSWLSHRLCWSLSRLGHLLVVLGQRLERYEVAGAGSSC